MSSKQNSTIGAKPAVQPNIEAWIGGGATEGAAGNIAESARKVANGGRKASQTAKQPADKPASQQTSQPAESEAMAMLSARIPAPLMKQLRIRAATEDRQIQDIIAELLRGYLGKV